MEQPLLRSLVLLLFQVHAVHTAALSGSTLLHALLG